MLVLVLSVCLLLGINIQIWIWHLIISHILKFRNCCIFTSFKLICFVKNNVPIRNLCFRSLRQVVYNKENLERQETNEFGRGTEWHLPKTDKSVVRPTSERRKDIWRWNETKMNISARSQWSSSAVSCILLLRKATVIWPVFYSRGRPLWSGRNIHFHLVLSLYVVATLTHGSDNALVSLR